MKTTHKAPKVTPYYTRRDSATTILRKMGVPQNKYNDFIEIAHDDEGNKVFKVDVVGAKESLGTESVVVEKPVESEEKSALEEEVKALRKELADRVQAAKDKEERKRLGIKAPKVKKPDPVITNPVRKRKDGEKCAEYCRAAILCGHTNQEIFAALKEHFNHGDNKRNYPGWYRHKMREAGLL